LFAVIFNYYFLTHLDIEPEDKKRNCNGET